MSISENAGAARRSSATIGSLLVFGAAFALWAALYLSGALPWLGYAWMTRSSSSGGGIGVVGETRAGSGFGATTFLFFQGQNIVIDYRADIRAGALWLYVYRPFDGVLGDGVAHFVTETSAGVWAVHIPQTGIYSITIAPTVMRGAGQGWDLNYTAWWGAQPGA